MMSQYRITSTFSVLMLFTLLIPDTAFSDITFTNGKWESTFNCAAWLQPATVSCDALSAGGSWFTTDGQGDQITSAANNPLGTAGTRGLRHWSADGVNIGGGGLSAYFRSQPSPELWIRWYQRYQLGFTFSALRYYKQLYIHTAVTSGDVIPEFVVSDYSVFASSGGATNYAVRTGNYGWKQVNRGATGDGNFHLYEVHIKMDTNSADGVGQLWIDGVLRASSTTVNWSGGNASARLGWTNMQIGSNFSTVASGHNVYSDYDDIVVYNTTPPNKDPAGNPWIGPIGSNR